MEQSQQEMHNIHLGSSFIPSVFIKWQQFNVFAFFNSKVFTSILIHFFFRLC